MNEGYIMLHRAIKDWRYKNKPNFVALWIEILIEANWKKKRWQDVELNEGEFITSRQHLSQNTGLTEMQVRSILNKLNGEEITIKTTNKFTQIKVNKWLDYQCCDDENNQDFNQQITNKQPTNNQQITTTNKDNKEIKIINTIYSVPSIEEVKEYIEQNNYQVDYLTFFNYYEELGWKDKDGKKVKNWKLKCRTWHIKQMGRNDKRNKAQLKLPTYDASKNSYMSKEEIDELLKGRNNEAISN